MPYLSRYFYLAVGMVMFFIFSPFQQHVYALLKQGPYIGRLYLSRDMRVANISFSSQPGEDSGRYPLQTDGIILLHEKTGIRMTLRLSPVDNGYTFYNYGLLLKRGDRVAVLVEGFLPAYSLIE